MRFLFVDIETDGIGSFRPPRQRILQLVCEIYDPLTKKSSQHVWYSNAVKKLGETHPSPYLLKTAREEGTDPLTILTELSSLIKPGDRFIAHNAVFDFGVILHECSLYPGEPMIELLSLKTLTIFCTMERSTDFCKLSHKNGGFGNQYKYPRLTELAECMGIPCQVESAHNAIYDVELLKKCFENGIKRDLWI